MMRVWAVPPIQLWRYPMSVFDSIPTTSGVVRASDPLLDEAEFAAVASLARYSGRR